MSDKKTETPIAANGYIPFKGSFLGKIDFINRSNLVMFLIIGTLLIVFGKELETTFKGMNLYQKFGIGLLYMTIFIISLEAAASYLPPKIKETWGNMKDIKKWLYLNVLIDLIALLFAVSIPLNSMFTAFKYLHSEPVPENSSIFFLVIRVAGSYGTVVLIPHFIYYFLSEIFKRFRSKIINPKDRIEILIAVFGSLITLISLLK